LGTENGKNAMREFERSIFDGESIIERMYPSLFEGEIKDSE
jgi:hypothetical protein